MKALIADDNVLYCEVLEMVLIEEGYKVRKAKNGADALNILIEDLGDSYDLIVTDQEMPVLKGCQLIREILDREIKFRRLILLTASLDEKELVKEFVKFGNNILVIAKDTPISHLKDNLFKI